MLLKTHKLTNACWSNGASLLAEIRRKIGPLKVIESNTDRSYTCDFLLGIHGNYGPISYRFQSKRR